MEELRRSYHDQIADLRAVTIGMVDDAAGAESPSPDARLASVESAVLDMLAQQAPLARDLRVILAALRIAQIADLCLGLRASLAKRRESAVAILSAPLRSQLEAIGGECCGLLEDVADAWRVMDSVVAAQVLVRSEQSRALQQRFLAELIGETLVPIEAAVDLGFVTRAYERLTDHAVEIAERVMFAATGDYLASSSPPPSTTSATP